MSRALLEGIRVLDLTAHLSGPYATMILTDMGAETIKVERREAGDLSRMAPPLIDGLSSYFLSVNRGKKSITLDLKKDKGRNIVLALAKNCDIFVQNFIPGAVERLGLGYDEVRQRNPKVIYGSVSGFGQTGPYATRPAFDTCAQAMAGAISINGEKGRPGHRVGYSISDIGAGVFLALGILGALNERSRSGEGQRVDVSMVDSQVALIENAFTRFLVAGEVAQTMGRENPIASPHGTFDTKGEGQIALACDTEAQFDALCQAIGCENLPGDPRYSSYARRLENRNELDAIINKRTRSRSTQEWLEVLEKLRVPCAPVNTIDQAAQDPVIASSMVVEVPHSRLGSLKMVNSPIKLSKTPIRVERPSPELGEHTSEVLSSLLGLTQEEIAELRGEEVI